MYEQNKSAVNTDYDIPRGTPEYAVQVGVPKELVHQMTGITLAFGARNIGRVMVRAMMNHVEDVLTDPATGDKVAHALERLESMKPNFSNPEEE